MDTVAAVATARAAAGIGIVRISGESAIAVADKVFKAASGRSICSRSGYSAVYGHVYDGTQRIDEAIALLFRAPKSYTGEDVVELSCHGGMYRVQRVLRAVLAAGAKPAPPGEFTRRAFINGRIDLSEAEAVMGLINASGQAAAAVTLNVLDGALSRKIEKCAGELTVLSASMAAWADFPDDDIPQLQSGELLSALQNNLNTLEALLAGFDSGAAVTQGVDTAIIGSPNVGKSTLLNLLTGYERAIVTPNAGTTRDIIEETVNVGNAVLRLADTAGIREDAPDEAEKIGVSRALEWAHRAQLVLAVLEASRHLTDGERSVLRGLAGKKVILVLNKNDLERVLEESELEEFDYTRVYVSASTGEGADALKRGIERILGADDIDTGAAMLITERQRTCAQRAAECIREAIQAVNSGITADAVNVSVDCAIQALFELTGKAVTQCVADEVFSRFCVGK